MNEYFLEWIFGNSFWIEWLLGLIQWQNVFSKRVAYPYPASLMIPFSRATRVWSWQFLLFSPMDTGGFTRRVMKTQCSPKTLSCWLEEILLLTKRSWFSFFRLPWPVLSRHSVLVGLGRPSWISYKVLQVSLSWSGIDALPRRKYRMPICLCYI